MKLIKTKVYFERTDDGKGGITTVYRNGYPSEWEAEKIPYIVYMNQDEGTDAKGTFVWTLVTVPDDLYDKMIQNTECCFAVTRDEALTINNKYTPRTVRITDQDKVLAVLGKVRSGETLTRADRDDIDPDKKLGVSHALQAVDIWRDRYGVQI